MPYVNEYMSADPVTARGKDGLLEAARRMRELHVGCLVVVDEDHDGRLYPKGMLTDRDIVVGVLAQTDRGLHLVNVEDVMTRHLHLANETDDLGAALKQMRKAGVRRLPVIDARGELKGLLSLDDILEYVTETLNDLSTLLGRERAREARRTGRDRAMGEGACET